MSAAHSKNPVEGLTHNYYKYPARFSPEFARATIQVFSRPGDFIVDPFVGGGTTLVEARVNGRLAAGSDISTLATFVSKTKTQILGRADVQFLARWSDALALRIDIRKQSSAGRWADIGYTRNLDCRSTWAIRKAIESALKHVDNIDCVKREAFARCLVLRAAQWAIDGREKPASVDAFRAKISGLAEQHLNGADEFRLEARRADRHVPATRRRRTICINARAEELAWTIAGSGRSPAKLVVTSPPYPGVHVLYHRWQVRGGRETPAPFWIANRLDGAGEAYYTMHARRGLDAYHEGIQESFSALAEIADRNTTFVQLVAFADPKRQLPKYLNVMEACGLREHLLAEHLDSRDGRIWRDVPGRRWHAHNKGKLNSGTEVVLFHRLA